MKSKFLVPVIAFMFTLNVVLPIAVFAQDAPPTIEEIPTVFQEPLTIEPQPTAVATETPAPVPAPVDVSLILPFALTLVIVAIVAIAGIAWVGIVQAAKGLPEWSRPILLANLDKGVDVLDDLTSGDIADAGVAELRKLVEQLRQELAATNVKVTANTQNIQATQQAVRSQNVG